MLANGVGLAGNASTLKNTACFGAGTPLLTPDGVRPIEQFQPGDWILSKPEFGPEAEPAPRRVVGLISNFVPTMELVVAGRAIRTTAEHPFWVRGRGWTDAQQLVAGDEFLADDGRYIPLDAVRGDLPAAPVYNLEVEDYHTYFVGGYGWGFSVWAHNDPLCTKVADAAETASDASGVSKAEYAALRRKTPSQEIRDAVNPPGTKIDPVYGTVEAVLEADHIVPMKEITKMPGFDKLTTVQQTEVLNLRENFMGLGKSSNASKGAKTWDDWPGHSKLGPVSPEVRAGMIQRQTDAQSALRQAIDERVGS